MLTLRVVVVWVDPVWVDVRTVNSVRVEIAYRIRLDYVIRLVHSTGVTKIIVHLPHRVSRSVNVRDRVMNHAHAFKAHRSSR